MIVVSSLPIEIRLALPRSLMSRLSILIPRSSVMNLPPVSTAMSSSIALRLSPNPGALTAAALSVPLMLLTTSVASASPSTSSAMISKGLPAFATFSNRGSMSLRLLIFFSKIKISASSKSHS